MLRPLMTRLHPHAHVPPQLLADGAAGGPRYSRHAGREFGGRSASRLKLNPCISVPSFNEIRIGTRSSPARGLLRARGSNGGADAAGEAIERQLAELLTTARSGRLSVYTCAPVLTQAPFRWRSASSGVGRVDRQLHGAQEVPLHLRTDSFKAVRARRGRIVFTLPNHYGDMADRGLDVECVDGARRFTITRERTVRIEQVELPLHQGQAPVFGDYIGCRFGQYSTPYWFSFEEADGRRHLSANHIQGQSFEFPDESTAHAALVGL